MGVTGLWKLIDPAGKPVPLETLENKVLAIDISIWLHQVVKGFQDNKGNTLAHAHLLGLFHRLCKLLYYRIKPVFVFDGGVPNIKRETIAKRNQSKNKLLNEADRLQSLLLQTLAKEKVVKEALGSNAEDLLKSPKKSKPSSSIRKPDKDDMFKLPELPTIKEIAEFNISGSSQTTVTDSDSSLDERNLREAYAHNLQAVNVMSNEFKNLPPDVRYEILTDIKETRKQSSWGRLHELPAKSDQFSSFQMKRLLKRRQVQVCLEEAEKQMEGRSLTLSELQAFLTEEGVITAKNVAERCSRQIASDENTRYLLVRDLKKAIEAAARKEVEERQKSQQSSQESPSSSQEFQAYSQDIQKILPKVRSENSEIKKGKKDEEDVEELDEEYDEDLQKAIEMSLESSNNTVVYDDKDYECDEIKMNREQRKLLKDAAASLAKAYLVEYGGMNEDEVKEMLELTQLSKNNDQNVDDDDDDDDEFSSFNFNDKFILKGEMCSPYRHMKIPLGKEAASSSKNNTEIPSNSIENENRKEKITIREEEKKLISIADEFISDSDDSDLVEVAEKEDPSPVKSAPTEPKTEKNNEKFQITIDLTQKLDKNDDIFADIFENEEKLETKRDEPLQEEDNTDVHSREVQKQSNLENNEILSKDKVNLEKITACNDDVEMIDDNSQKNSHEEKKNEALTPILPISSKSSHHENILAKLKEDLKNVENITLNIDDDVEMENDKIKKANTLEISSDIKAESILNSLKKELSEIPKISLDDIKINESSTKITSKTQADEILNSEIIEIPDDDSDSINITPSKRKAKQEISNYFETHYKIKRTPDKSKEEYEDLQSTPKMKSPFFVRKTPGSSGHKRKEISTSILDDESDDETPSKKGKKISKSLFGTSESENTRTDKNVKDDDLKPIDDDPLQIAAKILKDNKTEEELKVIATDIVKEKHELELERNRQDRMGKSITDKMSYECMHLLRLFGIPYVVAPMEAEAQCAFLDAINLTDGTITDDSDIWLFGGRTVYKNFFNQQKYVMEFRVDNIEKSFNVDRKKLIQLAILVGSDYTQGISGIGAVTALEILATFPSTPSKDGETSEVMSVLSSLRKFREWWRNGKSIGPNGRTVLRSKLKNIELNEGFPNINVVEAYLNPKVDISREKFSWGTPDVETIYEFTKKNFGWTKIKTDEILQPVLKKINEKKVQLSIKNYFTVKSSSTVRELKVSKRVQKAIEKLSFDPQKAESQDDDDEPKPKKSRSRKTVKSTAVASTSKEGCEVKVKTAAPKRGKRTKKIESNNDNDEIVGASNSSDASVSTCSTHVGPSKPKLSKLLEVNLHEKIPQREKDSEEMRKRKDKAAEVLKKAKENQRSKKNVSKYF